MTSTPPSTVSSLAGHSLFDQDQYKIVRKRNRVPLSCHACRQRKLKCDRGSPCKNCVQRGTREACSYSTPVNARRAQLSSASVASTPDDMQKRIDRLESLVLSLVTNDPQQSAGYAALGRGSISASETSPESGHPDSVRAGSDRTRADDDEESDVESVSNSFGILKVDNESKKSVYIGGSHWHTILSDISEVKNFFKNHQQELKAQYKRLETANAAIGAPILLFGPRTSATEAELRAAVPNISIIEQLVSRFFNSDDMTAYVVHRPTFYRELAEFARNPSETCIVWIALLNAILCLGMQSYATHHDEPPQWNGSSQTLAAEYRTRTVQCLLLSDYSKPVDYTLETMLLYTRGEYSLRSDVESGTWLIIGTMVRLALRMGYHKDPKHFPGLTPFKGEMRRRTWSFLKMWDSLFSFQLSMPSMIRHGETDTEEPRNIFDEEMCIDSAELPPARPWSDFTPVTYPIIKCKLATAFGEILEQVNLAVVSKSVSAYDEVMKQDNNLRVLRSNWPGSLALRPLDQSLTDSPVLMMQRYDLDIFWHKTLCVLHRKYFVRARTNLRYEHSRRTCVESGMEILRHHATLHRESQLGGRMRAMYWAIANMDKHDFLLGAMIVCLDLYYDSLASPYQHDRFFWTAAQRAEMYAALETSQSIWALSSEPTLESYKASRILQMMLTRLRNPPKPKIEQPKTNLGVSASYEDAQPEEHSAAMTLGMLSSGGLTLNSAAFAANAMPLTPGCPQFANLGNTDLATINSQLAQDGSMQNAFKMTGDASSLMDMGNTLDWDAWDAYVQDTTALGPSSKFGEFDVNAFDTLMGMDMKGTFPMPMTTTNSAADTGAVQGTEQQDRGFGNSVFMGANTPGRM